MRTRIMTILLLAGAARVGAQETAPPGTLEIRPFAGAYIPTGAMRDNFKTAGMAGLQLAGELSRNFHVLASGSWTNGHNKFALGSTRTDVWQYDAGVEANLVRTIAGGWLFRPFVGVGAGARTYDYKAAGLRTRTCSMGYGAVGGQFEAGSMGLRLEARDHLSCFKSPMTGRSNTLNDVGLTLGVAYHLR
jgi:hypothetical protein